MTGSLDLVRMGDTVTLRQDDDASPVGTLAGYFVRFNEWTEIDNPFEGRFMERIAPGAFKKTLRDKGRNVQVLFNHGMDPQLGSKPLGVPSVIREDEQGVYVEVPLDDTSYNRDIAASLRSGALRGQSFQFRSIREKIVERGENELGLPEVTRTEVALREFGPVTFPAYSGTSAALRSLYFGGPAELVVDEPAREEFDPSVLASKLRALDARLRDVA